VNFEIAFQKYIPSNYCIHQQQKWSPSPQSSRSKLLVVVKRFEMHFEQRQAISLTIMINRLRLELTLEYLMVVRKVDCWDLKMVVTLAVKLVEMMVVLMVVLMVVMMAVMMA